MKSNLNVVSNDPHVLPQQIEASEAPVLVLQDDPMLAFLSAIERMLKRKNIFLSHGVWYEFITQFLKVFEDPSDMKPQIEEYKITPQGAQGVHKVNLKTSQI